MSAIRHRTPAPRHLGCRGAGTTASLPRQARARASPRLRAAVFALAAAGADACLAQGSEFIDSAASFLALFIIFVLPIGGIALFWIVHVLPEKIAEKRHHPQKDAIHVLCLLSLVFGGMLWPIAWLWAYSKPVLYKLSYGRDKHDDYYAEHEAAAEPGSTTETTAESATALRTELAGLRRKLEQLEAQTAAGPKGVVGAD